MHVQSAYSDLADALAAFQRDSVLKDIEIPLFLRAYVRRGRWPEMLNNFFEHQMTVRQALRLLHLRTMTEALPLSVMLLDLMVDSRVKHHVPLRSALVGESGLIYPYAVEGAPTPPLWDPETDWPGPPSEASPAFLDAVAVLSRAWASANAPADEEPLVWFESGAGRQALSQAVRRFVTKFDSTPTRYVHDSREPGEIVLLHIPRLCAHAWQASWDLWSVHKPETSSPRSVIFFGPDGESVIEYRLAPWLEGVAEIVITEAPEQTKADIIAGLDAAGLHVGRAELVAGARPGAPDRELRLNQIGAYGYDRPEDPELEAIALEALAAPESHIRRAAIQVAIHLGYASLKATILRMADSDRSDEIRQVAQLATRPVSDPTKVSAWERRK